MRLHRLLRKTIALATMSSLMLAPTSRSWAGDLQAEVDSMFNNLGAIGNYTAPGAFRGQTYNTYTGGSIFLRSPNKVYQLATIQFPYVKAGCGGIDVFGGSFSHLSAAEFKNMLRASPQPCPALPSSSRSRQLPLCWARKRNGRSPSKRSSLTRASIRARPLPRWCAARRTRSALTPSPPACASRSSLA